MYVKSGSWRPPSSPAWRSPDRSPFSKSRSRASDSRAWTQVVDVTREDRGGAQEDLEKKEGRRSFVPISRRAAENSALSGAYDSQFLHLGLERRPLHAQLGRGTGGAANGPLGIAQRFEDMFPLGVFKGFWGSVRHR